MPKTKKPAPSRSAARRKARVREMKPVKATPKKSAGVPVTEFSTVAEIIAALEARSLALFVAKEKLRLTRALHLAAVRREEEKEKLLGMAEATVGKLRSENHDLRVTKEQLREKLSAFERMSPKKYRAPGLRDQVVSLLDGDFARIERQVKTGNPVSKVDFEVFADSLRDILKSLSD